MNVIAKVDQIQYFNIALFLSMQYLPHLILAFRKKNMKI